MIHFPSRRIYRRWAKLVILQQRNGYVSGVSLSPQPSLADFEESLKFVEQVVQELEIGGQPLIASRLREWKKRTPEFSVSTLGFIGDRITLFIEIKPHPNGHGWYVNLNFEHYADDGLWLELRRAQDDGAKDKAKKESRE